MKNIAIITARGGSKRIPRKNIKNFLGKPILAYAIDAALNANLFDEVMVSTDDDEIKQIALKYGANVPFIRSSKTSNDYATTKDVLEEVLKEYTKLGKTFENLCCIYPCAPFLNPKILKKAYKIFIKDGNDMLMPIVKFSHPIQRALKINQQNLLEYFNSENKNNRTQDLEKTFHDVGMFYFWRLPIVENPKTTPFILDERFVQDIDTLDDWKMAEIKYKMMKEALKGHF